MTVSAEPGRLTQPLQATAKSGPRLSGETLDRFMHRAE